MRRILSDGLRSVGRFFRRLEPRYRQSPFAHATTSFPASSILWQWPHQAADCSVADWRRYRQPPMLSTRHIAPWHLPDPPRSGSWPHKMGTSSKNKTVAAPALNKFSFCAVASNCSAGTIARKASSTKCHTLACSSPNNTTTRADCELKEDGVCKTACSMILVTSSLDRAACCKTE